MLFNSLQGGLHLEKPGIEFLVWKTWKKHTFLSKPGKTWKNCYLKKPFLHYLLFTFAAEI